ncbi:hypothetical protein ACQU0X_26980 [Pseudovibrio ascidiaceicola]|uniref:hypothetical protein n=1 Tax=Pseudovibrio ascidiaceicola TaxID=285279 RepID=UPI003D35C7BE
MKLELVLAFISGLEAVTGTQITVLERKPLTEQFWQSTSQILCQKTGSFCSIDSVLFYNSNTEPNGQSRIIKYRHKDGQTKQICTIIPARDDVSPFFLAQGFDTPFSAIPQPPEFEDVKHWLMLFYAAQCLQNTQAMSTERASAFATLALGFMQGDPKFTAGQDHSKWRKMASVSGRIEAKWAADFVERTLMDTWKKEAADKLWQLNRCNVTLAPPTSRDTTKIVRTSALEAGKNCNNFGSYLSSDPSYTAPVGTVNDENLWLWMYEPKGIGAPPKPYSYTKLFKGTQELASFVLEASGKLSPH